MSIKNASINEGATSLTVVGGSAKTYSPNGVTVKNGIQIIDKSVADIRTRPVITVRAIPSRLLADGTWSFSKCSIGITRPKIASNGSQLFPSIEITLNKHVENTLAEIQELRFEAAQVLFDTDFVDLWNYEVLE